MNNPLNLPRPSAHFPQFPFSAGICLSSGNINTMTRSSAVPIQYNPYATTNQSYGDQMKLVTNMKTRRSKYDNRDRNYICGCGKAYLSQSALYTHTRIKHNGINFPYNKVLLCYNLS